jgi:hypothetical protein
MLALALVLILLGVLSILVGIFWSDSSVGKDTMMGIHLGPTPIFLWGVVAGALVLIGLRLLRWGTVREYRRAKDRRRLRGMADRIDELEKDDPEA